MPNFNTFYFYFFLSNYYPFMAMFDKNEPF